LFDVLIKNGRVVDGTGNPWFKADIGIKGEEIIRIGKINIIEAVQTIDATALVVSPGFFDLHTHDDFVFPVKNHSEILSCKIRQGITTCVAGNCGYSPFPLLRETADFLKTYCIFLTPDGVTWEWSNFDEYTRFLERQGLVANTAHLIGHGAVRVGVMGYDPGKPNSEQMERMKSLVREAMRQGTFGMSSGLIYPPGMWASTEEFIELSKVIAEYGGFYASHIRGHSETHLDAIREIIKVGEEARLPVHIHHQGVFGKKHLWKIPVTISMVEEARESKGLDVTHDQFPYSGANTTILAIFPPWALEGGVPKLMERLQAPEQRNEMLRYMETHVPGWLPEWPFNPIKDLGYDNILIIWCQAEKNKPLEGKTLEELGKIKGKHPFDAACDLAMDERGAAMCVYFGYSGSREEDWRADGMRILAKHHLMAFESDAILVGKGKPHPAAYGVMPRVLGRYVRETNLLTLEDAIRKITSLPARILGLRDRGVIREDAYADITIFNPNTVVDKSTYENPEQFPEGIEYVLINGKVVVDKGLHRKEVLAGKVLRRISYEFQQLR